jgi:RNA polymerase sigma factor (sigma-70 family)
MAEPLTSLLHHLRRLSPGPPPGSDADLLDRFARLRDEPSFAALVRRHGPMVHNVCRRVLGDAHAAEDAAQAAFLVLARKAGSLRRPEALAGWLHGVACRVALKAHGSRRHHQDLAAAAELADPRPDPLAEVSARDVLAVLEQEVQRLPQPARLAVVLCCLEGLSLEEAAARLGCTPGAVKGRLERGRQRLHERLHQRGLSLSAALGVAEVARLTGGISETVLSSTVDAATRFAAGSLAGASPAASLAEGVLRAMFLSRLKIAGVFLLSVALAGTAVGVLTLQAKAPQPAAVKVPKTGKDPLDPATRAKIRKLQIEHRDVLKKAVETRQQEYLAGRGTLDILLKMARRLLGAELDLATTAQQRLTAHTAYLELMKEVDKFTEARYDAGRATEADYLQARAARLEAEIGWLKAGGKEKKDSKEK